MQGDTTTVMAAALAAFNRGVKVAHLEAGLRSGNLQLPFPEEANRRLAGQVTSLHLAPTAGAKTNLLLENVDPALVTVTGNTVIDALRFVIDSGQAGAGLDPVFTQALSRPGLKVLVTLHRRESWGEPMRQMARAIAHFDPDAVGPVQRRHRRPPALCAFCGAAAGLRPGVDRFGRYPRRGPSPG